MNRYASNTLTLVADIGGTNTRIALADGTQLLTDSIQRYKNNEFNGLEPILQKYFEDQGPLVCKSACIDLAGPVKDGVGSMTNLDWSVDHDLLRRATGAKHVAILNDLQAQGYSIGHVPSHKLTPILAPAHNVPHSNATSLVINLGTGFNAAAAFKTPNGRFVAASECGHTTLPVRTSADLELYNFLETKHGFASVEDVLSGRGLERLYLFLGTQSDDPKEKSAADIMAAIASGSDARSDKCVKKFVEILGTVSGDLALTHLPFGGIFLVGGVARAITPYLERFDFTQAFSDKGRFTEVMQTFSVSAIEDDYAALIGCASYMQDTLK